MLLWECRLCLKKNISLNHSILPKSKKKQKICQMSALAASISKNIKSTKSSLTAVTYQLSACSLVPDGPSDISSFFQEPSLPSLRKFQAAYPAAPLVWIPNIKPFWRAAYRSSALGESNSFESLKLKKLEGPVPKLQGSWRSGCDVQKLLSFSVEKFPPCRERRSSPRWCYLRAI